MSEHRHIDPALWALRAWTPDPEPAAVGEVCECITDGAHMGTRAGDVHHVACPVTRQAVEQAAVSVVGRRRAATHPTRQEQQT